MNSIYIPKNLEEAKEIAESRRIEASRWGDKTQKQYVWLSDEYDGDIMDIEES